MNIQCTEYTDGAAVIRSYVAENGFKVTVESYNTYFTVYDSYDEPVATIARPRHGHRFWTAHWCNGLRVTGTAVSPRMALRSVCMHQAA